ncbi:MAG TPA: AtpZ/AtpI family protein [Elusimicrobiales bacterium]|nr:AtpZ/AtpI family protein [Elusimicrobiales bacterium]
MKTGGEQGDWKYAQTGLELAGGVLLGFSAGYWLDGRLGTAPWLMLGGATAGLAAGFYLFIKEFLRKDGK